jgi:NAD(P)-dependent dehydrogenase (short-subunit alcohol dehydrogenase family)
MIRQHCLNPQYTFSVEMETLGKSFTPTYHRRSYAAIDPSRPELSAKGKVVLITGGGQGIGKVTARAFAQANAYAIIITGRTQQTLLETKAELEQINSITTVHTYVGDVADTNAVRTIFDSIRQVFGRVDVLISNAGYFPDLAPISKQDPDDFWKAFEINTKGAFNIVQAFLSVASPNATLINVSTAAVHVALPGFHGYSASKVAALSLFEFVQNENDAIRVVNVQPGLILTDMCIKSQLVAEDDGEYLAFRSSAVETQLCDK